MRTSWLKHWGKFGITTESSLDLHSVLFVKSTHIHSTWYSPDCSFHCIHDQIFIYLFFCFLNKITLTFIQCGCCYFHCTCAESTCVYRYVFCSYFDHLFIVIMVLGVMPQSPKGANLYLSIGRIVPHRKVVQSHWGALVS